MTARPSVSAETHFYMNSLCSTNIYTSSLCIPVVKSGPSKAGQVCSYGVLRGHNWQSITMMACKIQIIMLSDFGRKKKFHHAFL